MKNKKKTGKPKSKNTFLSVRLTESEKVAIVKAFEIDKKKINTKMKMSEWVRKIITDHITDKSA